MADPDLIRELGRAGAKQFEKPTLGQMLAGLNPFGITPTGGNNTSTSNTILLPPSNAQPKKSTSSSKSSGSKTSGSSGSLGSRKGGTTGGSGGGGGGGAKAKDTAQVEALEKLLTSGFAAARDQRLANATAGYKAGDESLLTGYGIRRNVLDEQRTDNQVAEQQSSWNNLTNRARESTDLMLQAASQGAGETDQLNAQLIAARNWAANQSDVNRSYHDTDTSIRAAMNDLVVDTRAARMNLMNQYMADQEQIYATYQNQMSDTAAQLGNIYANPNSDSYSADKAKNTWGRMSSAATDVWKNPGPSAEITQWKANEKVNRELLNNRFLESGFGTEVSKRPSGFSIGTAKPEENPVDLNKNRKDSGTGIARWS